MTDEGLGLLRTLLAEQRQLREELQALRSSVERGRDKPAPPAGIAEHLRAISAMVEGRSFSINELLAHAAILSEGKALREVIVGMVGALNGKRLGKLLRRIEGQDIGGLRVERVGADRLGAIWVLRVCRPG